MNTENPRILITIATHGDELIGFRVRNALEKLNIKKGSLEFMLVNEQAFIQKKRFIDSDLNRAFPGQEYGDYEQQLAFNLAPIIGSYDIVIDIHSTTSELKDALIVTKINDNTKMVIEAIQPKYLLFMAFSSEHALISSADVGIAFEYGKDDSDKAFSDVVEDITTLLKSLDMITGDVVKKYKPETRAFRIDKPFDKQKGDKLSPDISNYQMVKKGDIVATRNDNQTIIAEFDFYPILFGEENYDSIFGFIGNSFEI